MTRLKEFLFKYKHAIIILYMPIYLLWFTSLEKRTNVHFTDIHCKIDDYIPFCEFFIIPYLLWFLYVAVSLVYLFFQTKHLDDFYRCCAVLLLGMTTSLLIYTIFQISRQCGLKPLTTAIFLLLSLTYFTEPTRIQMSFQASMCSTRLQSILA